ncbi:N-acetylmuramoyl-L-alanine amidase [Cyanobium sp. ATX-6F1]|uniref:peptidoglycan recognition protein family protein n=1 Tax=Cyanobium sp. ATX-6F1 TaxID=3137388 RepID=UPI0039BE4966
MSYHTLIGLQGEVVQVLDPSRRAFGAGNSAFNGQWVVTNPKLNGSVNNFALHLSLETPLDGENDDSEHSGYTAAQLDATAVVLADWMKRFPIPPSRSPPTGRWISEGNARIPAASIGAPFRCAWRPWADSAESRSDQG